MARAIPFANRKGQGATARSFAPHFARSEEAQRESQRTAVLQIDTDEHLIAPVLHECPATLCVVELCSSSPLAVSRLSFFSPTLILGECFLYIAKFRKKIDCSRIGLFNHEAL